MAKVTIIGGGPAGSTAGHDLACSGHEVTIIEEHAKIGEPMQCTGIVTSKIRALADVSGCTANLIESARIVAGKKSIEIPFSRPNIILDRCAFDAMLADRAKDAGAMVLTNTHVSVAKRSACIFKSNIGNKRSKTIYQDHLIGADGPLSITAKQNGMWNDRKMWQGIQARVKLRNDNKIEFYPDVGTFAWIVPEDRGTVRIGLLCPSGGKKIFDTFCKRSGVRPTSILEMQGGLVPIYDPRIIAEKDNTYLVGDAALQVKATTGGGIIQGMIAAKELARCIDSGQSYQRAWKHALGRELWMHLAMRKMMGRFSPAEWEELVEAFQDEGLRRTLSSHDRDDVLPIALRAAITPKLWKFARHALF